MKKYLLILLVAWVSFFSFACSSYNKKLMDTALDPSAQPDLKPPAVSTAAAADASVDNKKMPPDFNLQDIYQDNYILSSYRGEQPVLLFFWTTWCPFCQKELKVLNDMYAGLTKDGIMVLSVNVGELPQKVRDFVKNYFLAYKILLDSDSSVSNSFEIIGIPTYILLDKDGYIVFKDSYFPQGSYKDLISK